MKQRKPATKQTQQQTSNRFAMSNCESHRKPGDGKTWENEDGKLKAVVLIAEPTAQIGKTLPSAKNNCLQDQTAREKKEKNLGTFKALTRHVRTWIKIICLLYIYMYTFTHRKRKVKKNMDVAALPGN